MPVTARLRKPLERAIRAGHPWVYRDALVPAELPVGEPVSLLDKRGRPLAIGLCESGPIAIRIFSTDVRERIRPGLFKRRIHDALALRTRVVPPETDCYRLIHGEGDGLPGLVCDRYGELAVLKLDGEAIESQLPVLTELVASAVEPLGVQSLLLRSSRKQRAKRPEAEEDVRVLSGPEPPREVVVRERGIRLLVNPYEGQKTGLFLDHRESRARVRELAHGLCVLNLYGYTGAFSLAAACGGASAVTTVDIAKPALDVAEKSFALNPEASGVHRCIAADVPSFLRESESDANAFDLVIADPPNFAPKAQSLENALESYRLLHAACLRRLNDGGLYLAASCSSHVRLDGFLETLRDGARQARKQLTILETHGAPADHPRRLAFPEGDYLKVVLCRSS